MSYGPGDKLPDVRINPPNDNALEESGGLICRECEEKFWHGTCLADSISFGEIQGWYINEFMRDINQDNMMRALCPECAKAEEE